MALRDSVGPLTRKLIITFIFMKVLLGRILLSTLFTLPLIVFLWANADHHTGRKVASAKYKSEALSKFRSGSGHGRLSFK